MPIYHFERALFVVGAPNAGKSNQLRSMFRDARLGTGGVIPTNRNVAEFYRLSNQRCLYLRLSSPHEMKECIRQKRGARANFLQKTAEKIEANTPHLGSRWNFASALQPRAENYMPDLVATCHAFVKRFNPERTRIAFLSPDRHGVCLQKVDHLDLVTRLRQIPSIEICWIDARDRAANGLLLADFFDFT